METDEKSSGKYIFLFFKLYIKKDKKLKLIQELKHFHEKYYQGMFS